MSINLWAQQSVDDVDYQYDKSFLETLVQAQIDSFRVHKKLPPFTKDKVLDLAAADQTNYIAKTGRVSHKQPSNKKNTPFKRAMFYDGMHEIVGENCYKLIVGTKTKLPREDKKTKLKSYKNVAKAIALNWISSKEGSAIISNPKYVHYGVSIVLIEETKTIVATHVVGSQPFVLPDGAKNTNNA